VGFGPRHDPVERFVHQQRFDVVPGVIDMNNNFNLDLLSVELPADLADLSVDLLSDQVSIKSSTASSFTSASSFTCPSSLGTASCVSTVSSSAAAMA
jgi:hypothetical protein